LRINNGRRRARKDNSDLGELAGMGIDVYRTRMLLDNNVVTNGQAKTCSLSRRLRREEGIEYLVPHLRQTADTVIANPDFSFVAKVLCRSRKGRLIAIAIVLLYALGRRIEAVGDKVQKCSCDLLRVHIDLTGSRMKRPLKINLEALL